MQIFNNPGQRIALEQNEKLAKEAREQLINKQHERMEPKSAGSGDAPIAEKEEKATPQAKAKGKKKD